MPSSVRSAPAPCQRPTSIGGSPTVGVIRTSQRVEDAVDALGVALGAPARSAHEAGPIGGTEATETAGSRLEPLGVGHLGDVVVDAAQVARHEVVRRPGRTSGPRAGPRWPSERSSSSVSASPARLTSSVTIGGSSARAGLSEIAIRSLPGDDPWPPRRRDGRAAAAPPARRRRWRSRRERARCRATVRVRQPFTERSAPVIGRLQRQRGRAGA